MTWESEPFLSVSSKAMESVLQADTRLLRAVEDGTATAETTALATRALLEQWQADFKNLQADPNASNNVLLYAWVNAGQGRLLAEYWEKRASEGTKAADDLAIRRTRGTLTATKLFSAAEDRDLEAIKEAARELGDLWDLPAPASFKWT
jgi:hypothetical protein